jgi:hypothetical protein
MKENIICLNLSLAVFGISIPKQVLGIQPFLHFPFRLHHKCSHRQATDETPSPFCLLRMNMIPKPSQYDGSRFAKAVRDVD